MLLTAHSTEVNGKKDKMTENENSGKVSLEAKSPFELRIYENSTLSEADVQNALKTGESGFLHSFTTGSAVDGPGVRVVAWTTGCQFRCVYCHNPDTWKLTNGIPVTVKRAIEELNKYRAGLKIMAGGFTLSGGEPLMQDRFAVKLFEGAKKMGIHTALDTNGAFGKRLSDADLSSIDLVLLDIKSWDNERHRQITGVGITPVLEFAERLASVKKKVWLRFVLVPGLSDNEEDVSNIARFAASLGNIERVDVLPFHQLGEFKWKELRLKYTLDGLEPPGTETIKRVCDQFRSAGLKTF
jgi:pyruvate formate lyase activating enzyme